VLDSIVESCYSIDCIALIEERHHLWTRQLELHCNVLCFVRYGLLVHLMKTDYNAYIAAASFLSPHRLDRMDLPNVQDVEFFSATTGEDDGDKKVFLGGTTSPSSVVVDDEMRRSLVEDCRLEDTIFMVNVLDRILLRIFRHFVTVHTGGVTSPAPGNRGLLEHRWTYMLCASAHEQHEMVKKSLKDLITPVLYPSYRVFVSGIVPNKFTCRFTCHVGL